MPETTGEPRYTQRYGDALAWAAELHARQMRKGTNIPYVVHLMRTSAVVWLQGGDEDQAIAALLHDAVEDQGGPPVLEQIRVRFGDTVARIVDACTDAEVIPKPPWTARKRHHLATIPTMYEPALLVTLADKYDNVEAILTDHASVGDEVWRRFSGRREGTVWYYQQMADALRSRMPGSAWVARFADAVTELGIAAGVDPLTACPPEMPAAQPSA